MIGIGYTYNNLATTKNINKNSKKKQLMHSGKLRSSHDSRIDSSPISKVGYRTGSWSAARTHSLPLLFLSSVWNDCQGPASKLRVHLLFLGFKLGNIFMRLRLLYYGRCGYEQYSGH
jgi:hypothetical protein